MPAPRLPRPAPAPSLPGSRGSYRELPPVRRGWRRAGVRLPCRSRPYLLLRVALDLHQRVVAVYRTHRLLQQLERPRIRIGMEERGLHRIPKAAQGAERMVHRGSFIAAVHHAVGAARVAGLGAVALPLGGFQQLLKGIGVSVLQQVAGFLPAKNVERGHAPGSAGVIALAHQEFQEQRRLVDNPIWLAVGQNGAEQTTSAGTPQEMVLVRRLV